MYIRSLILFLFLIGISKVHATELYEIHTHARALGMGNAYAGVVSDDESLWYNPAGIAKNSAFVWNIADVRAGLNDLDALDIYGDLTDDTKFATTLDSMYGEPLWQNVGGKTSIIMPYFMFAYYADLDFSIHVQNPAATQMDINFILDQGVALGTGFTAGLFQMGLVGRRVERTGVRQTYGPGDIAGIIDGGTTDTIFENLDNEGLGYAADLGMNLHFPGPVSGTLSFVWKNIGDTKFRTDSITEPEPPKEEQEFVVGGAVDMDLGFMYLIGAVDFKHIEDYNEPFTKKIHMGLELGLPLIDLRVGLHQGYLTYGAGFGLGLVQVDAAYYGVELGEYAGQFFDERYVVQAAIKVGFGPNGFTTGQRSADSSSASASGGRSGSSGRGGSGRWKKARR